MATDHIAMLVYPSAGLIATRDKLTAVRGSDVNEIAKNMYQAAPDVKVVYIFTLENKPGHVDTAISALQEVGFDNVKLVNSMSWFYTEMLHRSQIEMLTGECVAVVTQSFGCVTPNSYEIFEKTSDGYIRIGNQHSCDNTYFRFCPVLKNILILNIFFDLSDFEKSLIKKVYPRQNVYFNGNKGRNWLRCMWDEYDGKVRNFLPALLEMKIEFKHGNNLHIETVDYSQLPFEKVLQLDIEDACKLEVNAKHYASEHMKIDVEYSPGKNRVLNILLKVGLEFYPVLDDTVASEKDTVEGAVYVIGYKRINNTFTGTLITADRTEVIIDNGDDVSEVFKQLDSKKGSAKLRGVFVDYTGHVSFPLDTHRVIVNALPSPRTKVCVGHTHSQTSRDVCLQKTNDGFKVVDKLPNELLPSKFTTVVFIVENKKRKFNKLATVFPSKKVLFSESSELPKNVRHLFAWEYFNGKNFDGYMVEPCRGVVFDIKNGSKHYAVDWYCDYNYGSSECYITCAIDKQSDTDSKFTVDMNCVGYSEKCTVLEIPKPKSDYVLLHICVDEHLIPTVTVTETNTPLLPEGLATRDKSVIKNLKSTLEKLKDATESVQVQLAYNVSVAVEASDVEKLEKHVSDNRQENGLKDLDKTTELWDNLEVESILPESDTDSNGMVTASKAVDDDGFSESEADVSNVAQTVVLTFTHCNRVLISAGPDYTGIDEIPAYLRLTNTDGKQKFIIGQKAKAALKTDRESVIYDVPGLLAANFNPKRENAAWTFDTSRADDGKLLVHLSSNDCASPVVVFGFIVYAVIQYVKKNLPSKLERIGIRLPNEASVSVKDLSTISSAFGVEFIMV